MYVCIVGTNPSVNTAIFLTWIIEQDVLKHLLKRVERYELGLPKMFVGEVMKKRNSKRHFQLVSVTFSHSL